MTLYVIGEKRGHALALFSSRKQKHSDSIRLTRSDMYTIDIYLKALLDGNFITFYLVCGNILIIFWLKIHAFGQIYIVINGQTLMKI